MERVAGHKIIRILTMEVQLPLHLLCYDLPLLSERATGDLCTIQMARFRHRD